MAAVNNPRTLAVLAALRAHVEGNEHEGWQDVYLDNANVPGMSAHAFAGHLAALTKAGLYKPMDGEFAEVFGEVKLED